MLKLKLSPEAIKDLEVIFEYTYQSYGILQAEKYQDELFEGMLLIARNPEMGSIYYFKEGNYRKLNLNRHIVFYRNTENECVVVRILHERVDLKTNLSLP